MHVSNLEIIAGVIGFIALLRLLRPRRRPGAPGRSSQQRRNTQAGQVGENRTTRILRQHFGTGRVWPDVHVAAGHRTSQCDHLVYGPFGVVVVETKHWTGALTRINSAQWSQVKPDGTRHRYDSPEAQNAYHCQVVRQVLRQQSMGQVPVYGAIVLSNRNAVFVSAPGAIAIGTPDEIARWIARLPAAKGRLPQADRVEGLLRSSGVGVSRAVPWG